MEVTGSNPLLALMAFKITREHSTLSGMTLSCADYILVYRQVANIKTEENGSTLWWEYVMDIYCHWPFLIAFWKEIMNEAFEDHMCTVSTCDFITKNQWIDVHMYILAFPLWDALAPSLGSIVGSGSCRLLFFICCLVFFFLALPCCYLTLIWGGRGAKRMLHPCSWGVPQAGRGKGAHYISCWWSLPYPATHWVYIGDVPSYN